MEGRNKIQLGMELISMTEKVFELEREYNPLVKTVNKLSQEDATKYERCFAYAIFLSQPLKLEMFVPCDDEGNVMIESSSNDYQKAKEKVLFKGFEIRIHNKRITLFKNGHSILSYSLINNKFLGNQTVERLVGWNLELTQNAIKQL